MSDDYGIGKAALIGLEMGRDIQRRQVLNSWKDHAADLERALEEAKRNAYSKQLALDTKTAEVRLKELQLRRLTAQLADAEEALNEQNRRAQIAEAAVRDRDTQVRNAEIALMERDNNAQDVNVAHARYREEVAAKIAQLEGALRSTSGQLAAVEGIYRRLIDEIALIDDPARFAQLDTSRRAANIDRIWDQFIKTGKLEHLADFSFSHPLKYK